MSSPALTRSEHHASTRCCGLERVLCGQISSSHTQVGTLVIADKGQGRRLSGASFVFPWKAATLNLMGLAALEGFGHLIKLGRIYP